MLADSAFTAVIASRAMAAETLWGETQAAVREAGELLTTRDKSGTHAIANAKTFGAATLVTAVVMSLGIGLPVFAELPTWTLYVGFMMTAVPASLVGRAWQIRADARLAAKVRALAAQRRAERAAASTIPALGAGGGVVAVPGLVDERVRQSR